MFTITQSLLVCIFVKTFLHAVFTVLLAFALYLAISNKRGAAHKRHWLGLAVIVVMYLINTAHIGMMMHQDIRDLGTGGRGRIKSARDFALFGLSQITMEYVVYVTADILLLWRTWVIFHGNYIVIAIPACLILGMMVVCFSWLHNYFAPLRYVTGDNLESLFGKLRSFKIRRLHLASVILTATTNATLTGMITCKILWHHRKMRAQLGFATLVFESIVIIESGAIYTVGWLIYIVTFATKHNAQAILLDSLAELAGIVPTLILVTVALGISPASADNQHSTMIFRAAGQVGPPGICLDSLSIKPDHHGDSTMDYADIEDTSITVKHV